MIKKGLGLLLCSLFFFTAAAYPAAPARLQNGVRLYGEGKWREAITELRRAQTEASDPEQRGEALYWVALAEISAGDHTAAVADMEELVRVAPASPRRAELPYHMGRAYYYLGRYDEAVVILTDYAGRVGEGADSRKSASLYWIGECLFALGQLDQARDIFFLITDQYPRSAKFEAAAYRIDLINQKKIEIELLALLKWSHEESLRTMEEYQRRERSYDQALIAYQKRIAEMLKDTRMADLEADNANYRRKLSEAEERIRRLEADLAAGVSNGAPVGVSGASAGVPVGAPNGVPGASASAPNGSGLNNPGAPSPDLRSRAMELRTEIERSMKALESGGNGGTSP
ncbi:MAG: tetratricopeptide repeat protein [Treponema sp.]|jgi:TolA-binding protein|nr:tetratricopeptide repeat protein [Treponema sp.]